MALQTLKFRPNVTNPDETKLGYAIFNGSAWDYPYWVFRTQLKFDTSSKEDFPKTMTQVVEALRGDALRVAMGLGNKELLQEHCKTKLMDEMKINLSDD